MLLAEAEATSRGLGAQRELARTLDVYAELAALRGDRKRAFEGLDQAAALNAKGDERGRLAQIRAWRARLDEPYEGAACRRLEAAARELQAFGDQETATARIWTARCWSEAGSPRRALPWLDLVASDPLASQAADVRIQLALARAGHAIHTGAGRRRSGGSTRPPPNAAAFPMALNCWKPASCKRAWHGREGTTPNACGPSPRSCNATPGPEASGGSRGWPVSSYPGPAATQTSRWSRRKAAGKHRKARRSARRALA